MALSDFLLNTDYPIDKVIYRSTIFSMSLAAYDYQAASFAHGNGGVFLPLAQWSFSSTFASGVYDIGTSPTSLGVTLYNGTVSVDATNIYYTFQNNTPSSVTIYFRVIGLAISGSDRNVAATSQYQDLVLNTDNNYLKIVAEGQQDVLDTQSLTVSHNLGYLPKTLVWSSFDSGITISRVDAIGRDFIYGDSGNLVRVTNADVIITNLFGLTLKYYYKVYG